MTLRGYRGHTGGVDAASGALHPVFLLPSPLRDTGQVSCALWVTKEALAVGFVATPVTDPLCLRYILRLATQTSWDLLIFFYCIIT